jgi:hypothetical protein
MIHVNPLVLVALSAILAVSLRADLIAETNLWAVGSTEKQENLRRSGSSPSDNQRGTRWFNTTDRAFTAI